MCRKKKAKKCNLYRSRRPTCIPGITFGGRYRASQSAVEPPKKKKPMHLDRSMRHASIIPYSYT